jgi:hypothetical protein
MTKYFKHPVNEDGWTDWYIPGGQDDLASEKGYKLACCDCGLVHQIQFQIKPIDDGGHYITMRAKRDERATAAHRRGMKTVAKDA